MSKNNNKMMIKNPSKKISSDEISHNYIFEKDIGEGTFGKVKLATHILTNEKV